MILREGFSVQFTWTEQMCLQVPSGHLQPSRLGDDHPGEGGSQPAFPEGAPLRQGALVSIGVGNAVADGVTHFTRKREAAICLLI